MIACGLDFGTSNSAIGVVHDKKAALAPIEADSTLMPSAATRPSRPMSGRPKAG